MSKASNSETRSYVKYTNIDEYNIQAFALVKEGFGSILEVNKLDTDDFLDAIEYLNIQGEIEAYEIKQGENN